MGQAEICDTVPEERIHISDIYSGKLMQSLKTKGAAQLFAFADADEVEESELNQGL